MRFDAAKQNVALLALCQALQISATSIVVATAPLVGYMLADNKALVTLPHALQWTMVALVAIPALMYMRRHGRRAGFMTGAAINMAAGAICVAAILRANFTLFCVGVALLGCGNGFAIFYRFAAAEAANEAWRGKAVSFVIGGGLIAAFAGPEIAKLSKDLLAPAVFAGTYGAAIAISAVILCVAARLRIAPPPAIARAGGGRPLGVIARQPNYLIAAIGAMIGWGVMVLMMTVTPVAMANCGLDFAQSALVIEWHLVGMFAPSLITGHLIRKFGIANVMLLGALMQAIAVATNLVGIEVWNFWLSNLLQGVGWNFLFVGGTTLVTTTYRPEERAKAQALNDFLIYGTAATSSFMSGFINHTLGWEAVNIVIVPLIVGVVIVTFWLRAQPRPELAPAPTVV